MQSLRNELDGYLEVLLGHEKSPIDNGVLTLMEYANAVFSRGKEIEYRILRAEAQGAITKGSGWYKFRTGELRAFCEIALRAAELGSRRLTQAQMEYEARHG